MCDGYLVSLQVGKHAISPSDRNGNLGLVKIHSLPINGLKVCTIFQHFYDFLGPSINMFGQVITRNSASGEEVGYMAFARHNPAITVSLVLQMIQREQACI